MMQIYQKKAHTDINPQEKRKRGEEREVSDKNIIDTVDAARLHIIFCDKTYVHKWKKQKLYIMHINV
jgi:hypothetical protein